MRLRGAEMNSRGSNSDDLASKLNLIKISSEKLVRPCEAKETPR